MRLEALMVIVVATGVRGSSPGIIRDRERPDFEDDGEIEIQDVCQTDTCAAEAQSILSMMDRSADPCNNFFRYACGGWINRYDPIPEGRGSFDQFDEVERRTTAILTELLGEPINQQDRDAIKKVKAYYRSCIDERLLDEADLSGLWSWIENVTGGMILFGDGRDDLDLETFLAKSKIRKVDIWGRISSPIINLGVHADDKNVDVHKITIDQPSLAMSPKPFYLLEQFASARAAYKNLLEDLLQALWTYRDTIMKQNTFNGHRIKEMANEILHLESDLAEIISPNSERQSYSDMYDKMTLGDAAQKLSSQFDWYKYIQKVFMKVNTTLTTETEIISYSSKYFSALPEVLERYNASVIQTYVVMYNILDNMNLLPKRYRDLASDYRKITAGSTEESPRADVCISLAEKGMPHPLGALYVNNAFSEDSKKEVIEIQKQVMSALKEKIMEVTWADNVTKLELQKMLAGVTAHIGYPDNINDDSLDDEFRELKIAGANFFETQFHLYDIELRRMLHKIGEPVDRDEWFAAATEANAYYHHQENRMIIPAGILHAPFFNPNLPMSMKFGGIGTVIGWMLNSLIESTGKRPNWWTPASIDELQKIKSCFATLYDSFHHEKAGMNLDGMANLMSNMNDNGALRHAFHAYVEWAKNNNDELVLPGLEDLDPKKLLFIANTQVWCEVENDVAARNRIAKGYTPKLFRAHGPIRNFEEFGKVFQCTQGSDNLFPDTSDTCVSF